MKQSTKIKKNLKETAFIIIISGPSGVGKGTIIEQLRARRPELGLTISATTRKPRVGEKNGVHYYFLSNQEFDQKVENMEFIEWCYVHSDRYGTLKSEVEKHLNQEQSVIIEIDVQGAKKIKKTALPSISIFIKPPSLNTLIDRLKLRQTETESVIRKRLETANIELNAIADYDYVVTNDTLEKAVEAILTIIDRRK